MNTGDRQTWRCGCGTLMPSTTAGYFEVAAFSQVP
jgi:hypothetical protein